MVPTISSDIEIKSKETEAAPSEEKGLFTSAKEAIVSAVTGGIESVKEMIHDVAATLEPDLPPPAERNPESPVTKEPLSKKLPIISRLSKRRSPQRRGY